MIHIVQSWNARHHAAHLEQMFKLRAREFRDRRKWDVVCVDDQERDWLDDQFPVYVLVTDAMDKVIGSCRLLPTTGPTLLQACFSDTMPDATSLVDPSIWECTRFCVDCETAGGGDKRFGVVTHSIARAVCGLALKAGIEMIIANIDVATLRMCRRAGYAVDVLGKTLRYGSPVYLGAFHIRQAADVSHSILSTATSTEEHEVRADNLAVA